MLGDVHIDNIINKNFNYLSIMCLQIDSLLFNFYIIKFVLYKGSLKKRKNTSILFILKRGWREIQIKIKIDPLMASSVKKGGIYEFLYKWLV